MHNDNKRWMVAMWAGGARLFQLIYTLHMYSLFFVNCSSVKLFLNIYSRFSCSWSPIFGLPTSRSSLSSSSPWLFCFLIRITEFESHPWWAILLLPGSISLWLQLKLEHLTLIYQNFRNSRAKAYEFRSLCIFPLLGGWFSKLLIFSTLTSPHLKNDEVDKNPCYTTCCKG